MIATHVKIGNLTYEVPIADLADLVAKLQAWSDANDKPVDVAIHLIPAGARRASALIDDLLAKFSLTDVQR